MTNRIDSAHENGICWPRMMWVGTCDGPSSVSALQSRPCFPSLSPTGCLPLLHSDYRSDRVHKGTQDTVPTPTHAHSLHSFSVWLTLAFLPLLLPTHHNPHHHNPSSTISFSWTDNTQRTSLFIPPMDDHPSTHHLDPNPEIITMAELENDPPQTSKCLTLSAIVLFLAFVASSVPTLLSPQPRTNTSVVKASSGVVQPSFIATNLPGQQQRFHQQQQQQQQVLPGAIVYTSPATIPPSQATADPLSPDQSPSTQNTPDQNDQQQRREHLIEKTTILELFLIAVKVSFKVAFWFLSLIYRGIRYAVVQPAGILMRLLETPLGMMREIYKTVMPVYSFFTVAAIIGVVVGGKRNTYIRIYFFLRYG